METWGGRGVGCVKRSRSVPSIALRFRAGPQSRRFASGSASASFFVRCLFKVYSAWLPATGRTGPAPRTRAPPAPRCRRPRGAAAIILPCEPASFLYTSHAVLTFQFHLTAGTMLHMHAAADCAAVKDSPFRLSRLTSTLPCSGDNAWRDSEFRASETGLPSLLGCCGWHTSQRALGRLCHQPDGLRAHDGAVLVLVRGRARHADRADHVL